MVYNWKAKNIQLTNSLYNRYNKFTQWLKTKHLHRNDHSPSAYFEKRRGEKLVKEPMTQTC